MKPRAIVDRFQGWIACVAEAVVAAADAIRSPRCVRLIEEDGEVFRVEDARGRVPAAPIERIRFDNGAITGPLPPGRAVVLDRSRIEIVLSSSRFLFRPLDLPRRAAEFLDGIVRSQIDRLTPWTPGEAVFGWTPPRAIGNERISLTVAATARARVMPYVDTMAQLGAKTVVIFAAAPAGASDTTAIAVLEHRAYKALDVRRTRRALAAAFAIVGLSALAAVAAAQVVGSDLEARQGDLQRRISHYRNAAIRQDGSGIAPARLLLEQRKQQTAASVLVLEALSKCLPDHTHVTELRIDGDRMQIVGMTQDAPSLIRLIEQSPHFTRAVFFAPTTRSPGEDGERFHIEARLKPVFTRT